MSSTSQNPIVRRSSKKEPDFSRNTNLLRKLEKVILKDNRKKKNRNQFEVTYSEDFCVSFLYKSVRAYFYVCSFALAKFVRVYLIRVKIIQQILFFKNPAKFFSVLVFFVLHAKLSGSSARCRATTWIRKFLTRKV